MTLQKYHLLALRTNANLKQAMKPEAPKVLEKGYKKEERLSNFNLQTYDDLACCLCTCTPFLQERKDRDDIPLLLEGKK
jgi:hypothetical protein